LGGEALYKPLREQRHETLRVRSLDTHLTRWGPPALAGESPVVMLHGWLDTGGTFQFLVDSFKKEWPCVALDWRGFGRSEWPQEGYSFPDYLGDLDALLAKISPIAPVHLIGHSMGGNIGNLYAGLRPERVRSLINLEGLGLTRTSPQDAPKRLRKWLDQIAAPAKEKTYNSFEQLTSVIQYRYPRFPPGIAALVAQMWGKTDEEGRVTLAADPRHHWVNPQIYKREDSEAIWAQISAPMLLVIGELSDYLKALGADGAVQAVHQAFPGADIHTLAGAGHMLHIEQPRTLAPLIEAFLESH
jgi:pimeloyl-ACP methyl ester carboxylesterase